MFFSKLGCVVGLGGLQFSSVGMCSRALHVEWPSSTATTSFNTAPYFLELKNCPHMVIHTYLVILYRKQYSFYKATLIQGPIQFLAPEPYTLKLKNPTPKTNLKPLNLISLLFRPLHVAPIVREAGDLDPRPVKSYTPSGPKIGEV